MYHLGNNKKEKLEEKGCFKSFKKEKKTSKKFLTYGAIGLGIVAVDYCISSKLNTSSLYKTFKEMNLHEIITNSYLGVSLLMSLGGGAIYGINYVFENDLNKDKKNKINNLEENLKN